jgi:hypothetical protein
MILTCREIRDEDLDELVRSPSRTLREEFEVLPKALIRERLRFCTDTVTVIKDGKVCVLAGIYPQSILGGTGTIWVMTTAEVEKHPMVFLRFVREYIHIIAKDYATLYASCLKRGSVSDRWLRALGFVPCDGDEHYDLFIYRRA